MKRTSWSTGLSVTSDGVGVVAHAGSVATRLLADRVGLTSELSKVMVRRNFVPGHDRGRVLTDVAVMLVDGGEAIADIDVLRHQSSVLGRVASAPTVWRALDEVTPGRLKRIQNARARVRRQVWSQLPDGVPASKVAGTDLDDLIVLDTDATIVISHSEKENAAATFKRTFGFHPLGVWCDNTSEFLAAKLRAGNAGSNTAADHIEVLTDAIAQIPGTHRKKLLIRSDGAGASHKLLDWLTEQNRVRGRSVEYSVGFAVTEKIRDAIDLVPKKVWTPALDADGGIRHAKDSGLGRFPSREFEINRVWLMLVQIAADLTAWTRLLALTGDAKSLAACEPKALRYRFLHVPARLTHSARRRRLRIPESWPWAAAIVAVFANIAAIPQPA